MRKDGAIDDDGLVEVELELDADVLAAFKATGKGWQTRLNAVLSAAVKEGRVLT